MKAARYYGTCDIRVEEVEQPVVKPGQVKIQVAWNALSSLDVQMYLSPMTPLVPTSKLDKLTGETAPIILGHQFSGTIVELGPDVDESKWTRGQKVAVNPLISCLRTRTCKPCAEGRYNVCPKATLIGIGGRGGGLAEYVCVDTRNVHILPSGVSLETGAMLEPVAVAISAIKRSGYKGGQTVLISGAGPIGLLILKVLRSIDPSSCFVVSEPQKARRELALQLGATQVADSDASQGIVLAKVYGETMGVDVAFETAGAQDSLDTALMCVKPHGTLVNVAVWSHSPTVNMNLVNAREIKLTGVMGGAGAHAEALDLMRSGDVMGIEELVTRKVELEKAVEEGILALVSEEHREVQILVHP